MKAMERQAAAAAGPPVQAVSEKKSIGGDNLGNKMLQRMGWKEGLGLGKDNQGRTSIIEVNQLKSWAFRAPQAVFPIKGLEGKSELHRQNVH